MRKILYLLAFMVMCSLSSNAQLKVDASGNVGIGTSTPSEALTVNGNQLMTHSSGGEVSFTQSTANLTIEKTRTAGNTLIDISPIPEDGTSNASFRFFRTTNTTGDAKFDVHFGNNTSAVNARFSGNGDSFTNKDFGNLGVGIGAPTSKLHVDGDIAYSGSLLNVSDRRLKKNIDAFPGGLKEVMDMNVVTYEYTGEGGTRNSTGEKIGVIAQELQEVAPYLVDEFTFYETDLEGEVISEAQYLRIKDNEIKYLLINSIKEQQEIINSLTDQLAELAETVEILKANQGSAPTGGQHEIDAELNGTQIAEHASLDQNNPNPFNETTLIKYNIPENATSASLQIFSKSGQLLKTVKVDQRGAGQLNLTANNLPSGTYMYSLMVDGNVIDSKSMVLTK